MYFSLFLFSSLEIRCDMNIFETTKAKLDSLDVKSYAADLPAGKIRWVDANRNTVAHADCKGIISFAGTNQSYVWISTMSYYDKIPRIQVPDGEITSKSGVSEDEARTVASTAAKNAGAEYAYAAPVAGGGFLYLAIFNMKIGDVENGQDDALEKEKALWEFIKLKMEGIIPLLGELEFESLFYGLLGELENQMHYVFRGHPVEGKLKNILQTLNQSDLEHECGPGMLRDLQAVLDLTIKELERFD